MTSSSRPRIAAVVTVPGPYVMSQVEAGEYLERHYKDRLTAASRRRLRAIFAHPAIRQRHFSFADPDEIRRETRDERVARFTDRALELAGQAASQALAATGLTAAEIEGLVVNTCTGYICPGLTTYLIERLGLPSTIKAYDLLGSGCGGVVPNLEVAEGILGRQPAGEGGVLSISVEICTATFQMGNDLSLILSNALFGDGAAAAVLWRRPAGYELVASASRCVPEQRDAIRYVYREGELHNQISLELPDLVKVAAGQVVDELLVPRKLRPADVRHWAVHTGGEKIVQAIGEEVGLSDQQLAATRRVLADYGNMSSPTVWFVLKELEIRGIIENDWVMLLTFGAGLAAHGYLLRKRA